MEVSIVKAMDDGFVVIAMLWGAWQTYKINRIKSTVDDVHTLSNSAMAAQLKLNVQFATASSVQLHTIAKLTQTQDALDAASAADLVVKEQETLLQAHLAQQAKIDSQY